MSSQGPNQNTVPNSGNTCGRRERGSRNEARGETSLRVTFVSVTVKGILASWKAALFAECRRKESLDRSVTCIGYPPEAGGAPVTADVRRSPRRGTLSACARKRMRGALARSLRVIRGRVLRSVLRPVHVNPHYTPRRKFRWWGDGPASRLGKPAQAGGTFTGVGTADVARLAACHRFREEGSVARTEKEGDRGLRPCEDLELGSVCLHVVVVAQIGRRCLASNKLGKRAPKRAVRVE